MWEFLPPRVRLTGVPRLPESAAARLRSDYEKFRKGLLKPFEPYILDSYGIDLTASYGAVRIKNPFGKASGQLSLATHQVGKDAEGGLGFVVLKTVIAQNQTGEQTMWEWAIPETRMSVERIRGRWGEEGWTVTWKGRGWYDTFGAYCRLFDEALSLGQAAGMLVVPSVKYHLPGPEEKGWKEDEYVFTTGALLGVWERHRASSPMPLEKDFSPTLAGSERAAQQAKILEWLGAVPRLIHGASPGRVKVGLKIFNTLFEDSFQLHLLEALHAQPEGELRADFFVYANRLFDPEKSFLDKRGVAYGGPDLSDRNLAVLERFLSSRRGAPKRGDILGLSATGDIHSGRIAAEYLLRGASTFQMHTLFQLPDSEFAMTAGSKTEKVLHHLLFRPQDGFLAWILALRERFGWKRGMSIQDAASWCATNWNRVIEEFGRDTAAYL